MPTVWESNLRVIQIYALTNLILYGGDSSLPLFVAWRNGELDGGTDNEDLRHHTLSPFTDPPRSMTLSNTDCGQWCLTFGDLMRSNLTDCGPLPDCHTIGTSKNDFDEYVSEHYTCVCSNNLFETSRQVVKIWGNHHQDFLLDMDEITFFLQSF